EAKVEDHAAVGVRVAHQGHRDINLYFDKKSGLLLKTERIVKDETMGGKERTQTTLHHDYKDIGGVLHPMKLDIKRDGEKYVDTEISHFESKEQTDDSVF